MEDIENVLAKEGTINFDFEVQLIETILNDLSMDMINTLYEIVVNNDFDYIENLFKNKKDFKDFIDKYKE